VPRCVYSGQVTELRGRALLKLVSYTVSNCSCRSCAYIVRAGRAGGLGFGRIISRAEAGRLKLSALLGGRALVGRLMIDSADPVSLRSSCGARTLSG